MDIESSQGVRRIPFVRPIFVAEIFKWGKLLPRCFSNIVKYGNIELDKNSEKKRRKNQRRKRKIYPLNAEFQRIARRDRKPSSVINTKK